MKFIVGLGNPGVRYQKTRHNIGRALVEYIAFEEKAVFKRDKKMNAMCADIVWGDEAVKIIYPEVFMNLSGEVLRHIKGYFPINAQTDLLIAVDDAALPFGALRLRAQGSSGGHNGLKSVASALESEHYARLRLGIGMPENLSSESCSEDPRDGGVPLHDYVLDVFRAGELTRMPQFLKTAAEACRLWTGGAIEQVMSVVNQRVSMG